MLEKTISLLLKCILSGAVILLIQACHSGSASVFSDVPRSPVDEAQEVKLHAQKTTTKPGASVKIISANPIVLNSTGTHDVELVLQSMRSEGEMRVDLTTSDGMSIIATTAFVFPLVEKGSYRLPINLQITHTGRHYIHLSVNVSSHGISEKRALSAIVQVGKSDPVLQKAAPATATDAVISLPAQERTSPRH